MDPTPTPAPPATDPPTPPTPPAPAGDQDNATIRQMREQLDAATAKLKALEREKLTDTERIRAENADLQKQLADLKPIQDEHKKLSGTLEDLYNQELAQVPEEHRERIKRLTSHGGAAERLQNLRDARALIPAAPAPPERAGTPTQPPSPGPGGKPPGTPPPAAPFDPKKPPSWRTVLSRPS